MWKRIFSFSRAHSSALYSRVYNTIIIDWVENTNPGVLVGSGFRKISDSVVKKKDKNQIAQEPNFNINLPKFEWIIFGRIRMRVFIGCWILIRPTLIQIKIYEV